MSVDTDEKFYDVIIAGAGPAGASAAIRLADNGCKVLLVEAKKFPRPKLCGEFISPECLPHFQALGVETEMLAANGTRIGATRFYSARGTMCEVPSAWFADSDESFALGLSRARMDEVLLNRARAIGVDVCEETQITKLLYEDDGAVKGAILRARNGKLSNACSRLTIDATGRARSLVRHLDSMKTAPKIRASLVAFKTHLARSNDADKARTIENACEIYFYPGGYGGLNGVENNELNLCFIVRAEDVKNCGADAVRVMREIVFKNRRAEKVLQNTRIIGPWLSVPIENFGRFKLAPAPNLICIGDAAAFIDPFTGSGMLMALESAATAAGVIGEWLSKNDTDFTRLANAYETNYRRRFERRLNISAYLRRAAFAAPPLIETAIRALNTSAAVRRRLARATRQSKASPTEKR